MCCFVCVDCRLVFVVRCVLCVACFGFPPSVCYVLLVVSWSLFVGFVFRVSWLLCVVCCGVVGASFSVLWRSLFGDVCLVFGG